MVMDAMVTDGESPVVTLDAAEAGRRARRVRLLLTDCDGVLTDATVYYSERGEELKRFSLRDGMGCERLREVGVTTAIVTREDSPIVARRAHKLAVRLWGGVRDKRAALPAILAEYGVTPDQVAYIGDDVNDLGVMEALANEGLICAPADAEASVLERVHLRSTRCGGAGAFRQIAEWIRLQQREEIAHDELSRRSL
jgi:3-deoxy-D-manno-octulosonate 8-phosphate phosphatase (KDO 8-P phosphatase)